MKLAIDRVELLKEHLFKKNFTVFANSSSLNHDYKNTIDVLFEFGLKPKSILGPQHGFIQDKQDNMIESTDSIHPIYEIPIYSLYGETRKPQKYMLKDIELILVDIQDVGARYYTYISNLYYILESAKELSKKVLVLDRPNPISNIVEGAPVNADFKSFVGIYEISNRHGMTIAEIALMFNSNIGADLKIIKMEDYNYEYWNNLDTYDWVPTSPNMPRFETSLVYPGMCLLEGTSLSEGRGTTIPFEVFGAPYIKHKDFLESEEIQSLAGVYFRSVSFVPTFNKFKEELCNGFYLHVIDKATFKPLKTALAIIYLVYNKYKEFHFIDPPYEYEYKKLPIDILLGTDKVRILLEEGASFSRVYQEAVKGEKDFLKYRENFLLY